MWIILLALVVVAAIVTVIAWSRARARPPDLGHVSDQWVAEHHASHPSEPGEL